MLTTRSVAAATAALSMLVASTACTPHRTSPTAGTARAHASPTSKPVSPRSKTVKLPPGVLAQARGQGGALVRVERRGGLRALTIGGVVQGAVRVGQRDTLAGEPLAALLRAVRPRAKRVLLVGLGTGRTAGSLSAGGFDVLAVEIEPKVIDFARRYFAFKGRAVAADGLAYLAKLERDKTRYDAIVLDAFSGLRAPAHLVTRAALARFVRRLRPGGVLAMRLFGKPRARPLRKLLSQRLPRLFTHLYGAGVGRAPQNLYVLHSRRPINLVKNKGLAVWPITYGGVIGAERAGGGIAKRRLELVGYLIRERASNALALDLPHWEMGALRFMLRGPLAAKLAKHLPQKTRFPTAGDIGSDGDTKKTARMLLGGGGSKRSDVRFSPVVVALEGKATLLSVVNPDSGFRYRRRRGAAAPPPPRRDRRLPYGGSLYALDVSRVTAVITRGSWRRLRRSRLGRLRRRAVGQMRRGKLGRAIATLDAYLAALAKAYPALAKRLAAYRAVERLKRALLAPAADISSAPRSARRLAVAVACDRAARDSEPEDSSVNPDIKQLRGALVRCAVTGYRRLCRRTKAKGARAIAARLLYWLEALELDASKAQRARLAREQRRLKRRFGRNLSSSTDRPRVR